ncbi:ABC transporter substrate-binding protein [Xenophilus arseniciresistens]|uniref:ABC transporter substrate-binding protein n=1 Tax=Xenophilus arseniciresistens TaxID=1283306 RepID=A0AAE3NCI3_9BURK|nr:ABC transporter substrate-binding protein [Xenophilus arseniciresistens]MDA7418693.1 ABC transporter substrate-binding protein [Xenophilus arseniciresistens]
MCERNGGAFAALQSASSSNPGRRDFLKSLGGTGAAVVVLPTALAAAMGASGTQAAGNTRVRATHGAGLCNLGIFIAKERQLTRSDGVDLEFVVTPTNTDIVTLFGVGAVDVSMIPYSNLLSLYDAGAPVAVVAGGGVNGCLIVAKEGIASAADMRGKTLGTFQADTLEVLPYDWLKKAGLSFKDVQVRYFNTSPEMAQAFIGGAVDAICAVEPYASQCAAARKGARVLSDGTDLYGPQYADCVLAVRTPLLQKQPAVVRAVIKALLTAQSQIESTPAAALSQTVGSYYKTTLEAATAAARRQPVMVDQRNQAPFILARAQSMKEMGYIKKVPGAGIFDWKPLEDVIAANKTMFDTLKLKSA